MRALAKWIGILFGVASSIVAGIWGGFEAIDSRMDRKVSNGEQKVLTIVGAMRDERNAKIQALDDKFVAEVGGVKAQLNSIDKNVRVLIRMELRKKSELDAIMKDDKLFTKKSLDSFNRKI